MDLEIAKKYKDGIGTPFADSLTGLFNHGFFQMYLENEVNRSNRSGDPFSVALIDVDSFSQFNKTNGPLEGDRLLQKAAMIVQESIRKVDLAARYSGDSFAVFMHNADTGNAMISAERITSAVEKGFDSKTTVSIGLAGFPESGGTRHEILKNASEALITAKIKGKNSIYCYRKNETGEAPEDQSTLLIVDDDQRNLKLLEAFLMPMKCNIIKANSGSDALSIVNRTPVDLLFLDVMMPEMDGYEVCRRIKGSEATRLIPVVLITALDDMEAKIKGIEAGADDFLTKPPNKLELIARTKSLLKLKKLNDNLTSIEYVLFSMANAVEEKDIYTQGHVKRVSGMAVTIGRKMGLSEMDMRSLKIGGALHDIGKIGVPNEILNKPGPLTDEEWEIMKKHPSAGYQICLPLKKNLGPALDVIRQHHEKLDGSGYPDGLMEKDISIVARIMAVADIFDALVTDRPYRKAMSVAKALDILKQESNGNKLDKSVVEHLIQIVDSGNVESNESF
ncbi:MAG: diguanylate cyclase [Proteobacteria bacterium]|nr:diguanylate cyclase [Pseudomonadota bacterium]MBU4470162.1 diguanylate cyclase [Pseudomonadota bacterium]MCG2750473.1 diguanylate cyclase [Desulfobacteraceae bacterium]